MTVEQEIKEQNLKKLYIKTYGCQMNYYDSEKMQDMLRKDGFTTSDDIKDSDLVILNTCHIREKASEKMYSELGRVRKIKDKRLAKEGRRTLIAVAGCVAQAEGDFIKKRAPFVDIIVGPQSYQRLPQMVNNALNGNKVDAELDFSTDGKFDFLREETEKEEQLKQLTEKAKEFNSSAFVTIQEGCDKFCSFCVVPYTRGAEVSRRPEEVYREALMLASKGVKEIVLLGQNVNAYHGKDSKGNVWGLGRLIEKIAEIAEVERIRYTTSHPRDMSEEIYDAHKNIAKLMPFLHLPVQSGNDRILKEMNRQHTAREYLQIIDRLRKVRPDMEFSSDFIVGYPGETEEEFLDTYKLAEEVGFGLSYSFIYSARPGTPAANKIDITPKEVKLERLQRLQALLERQMLDVAAAKLGKEMPVLINRRGKFAGQLQGFTEYMQPVVIDDCHEGNFHQVKNVKIVSIKDRALRGELVG